MVEEGRGVSPGGSTCAENEDRKERCSWSIVEVEEGIATGGGLLIGAVRAGGVRRGLLIGAVRAGGVRKRILVRDGAEGGR